MSTVVEAQQAWALAQEDQDRAHEAWVLAHQAEQDAWHEYQLAVVESAGQIPEVAEW